MATVKVPPSARRRLSPRARLLVLLTALLALAVLWFVLPARLSPLERSIVGTWLEVDGRTPDRAFVMELHADRTCLQRKLDGEELGPGLYSLPGKWHIKDGVLICTWGSGWRDRIPVRVVSNGLDLGWVRLPGLKWRRPVPLEGRIVEVKDGELTLQWPSGNLETLRRNPQP